MQKIIKRDLLYHYTSIDTLNCVLRKKTIWASDSRYLNDRDELSRAIELLNKHKERDGINDPLYLALDVLLRYNYFCILSLSESPEVLSQWRSYASYGHGACIGIDKGFLMSHLTSHEGTLVKCQYDDHDGLIEHLLSDSAELLDEITDAFQNICEGAGNVYMQWVRENSHKFDIFMTKLLTLKNSAFKEEREWRAIYLIKYSEVLTRVSENVIVPYTEVMLWNDNHDAFDIMVPEVWLGPKADKRNFNSLQCFMWPDMQIKHYDCGLR
jgi:hypothetical protein